MPRSVPGNGAPVMLFLLGDRENSGAGDIRGPKTDGNQSVMSVHIGEDYSTCQWPLVVKVQRGFSPQFVADRLEDLVDSLREKGFGFWGGVPEELPDHVRRAAEEDRRRLKVGQADEPVRVVMEQPDADDVICRVSLVRDSHAPERQKQNAPSTETEEDA